MYAALYRQNLIVGYLLQIFGPWCWVRHGHENTISQYGEHYEEAEEFGGKKRVKENVCHLMCCRRHV